MAGKAAHPLQQAKEPYRRPDWLRNRSTVRLIAGKVLTLVCVDGLGRPNEARRRMIGTVPSHDFARRTAGEIAPLGLPLT